ncbi:AraC family transcriptional regulator [Achromobacter marplatensis]|uniref:Helix-turn-helix domain-containing protein n=1 Tax=Achromobacter marplatensis TaxID=470868 RepID=A0AA43AZY2_9BURK|nr:helix-turn-helix domain-containing protein [Achromobacter marplatensis]MDH2050240.1 helix-turn-helix domain-containing protein [Achromobacter marplatensis]
MSFQSVYTRQVYSGLEPSQAFDVVYGGRFEHRLLSSRDTVLHHQRLIIGELRLETGCYDFPVIAQGCMPEDGICIGFMVAGGDRTKVNTTALGPDEIQIYPAGLELLYHATGPSRWVNLTVPHELLQRAATRRLGFSLTLPRQSARSFQLNPGGCHALTCAVDDALNMARRMQPAGGLAPDLACVIHDSLLNGYLDALGDATAAQGAARSIVERRHHHLISSCERLVLSGEDADVALADIAQRSGYSLRSLELIFRRSVGMTPSRWFMTARLNGALRDMLTQGQALSVSEIAGKWGFRHMSRFAQYFRQAFGESPRDTLRRARS